MTFYTILPMWNITRNKFTEKVEKLDEHLLTKKLDGMTIGELAYHTGEVEYMFATWFFDIEAPENIPANIQANKTALVQFLHDANKHFTYAMEQLDEEKWHEVIASRMGETTPAEAVARLIYHTGIHAGQISIIEKTTTH